VASSAALRPPARGTDACGRAAWAGLRAGGAPVTDVGRDMAALRAALLHVAAGWAALCAEGAEEEEEEEEEEGVEGVEGGEAGEGEVEGGDDDAGGVVGGEQDGGGAAAAARKAEGSAGGAADAAEGAGAEQGGSDGGAAQGGAGVAGVAGVPTSWHCLERLVRRARRRHNPPVLSWGEYVADVGCAAFDCSGAAGLAALERATRALAAAGVLHFDAGLGGGCLTRDVRTSIALRGHDGGHGGVALGGVRGATLGGGRLARAGGGGRGASSSALLLSPRHRRASAGGHGGGHAPPPGHGGGFDRTEEARLLAAAEALESSVVVLDPQWLADALSCLITYRHKFVESRGGLLTPALLPVVWSR
jgi:hypothetical protein